VGAAPTTVFLELDAVAVVDTALARDVVAPLALAALERHVDALVTGQDSPRVTEETDTKHIRGCTDDD
jgi:hypothetical protein